MVISTCTYNTERASSFHIIMSFDAFCQLLGPKDHKYKLIELSDDLVDYITNEKGTLTIKSPINVKNHLALCTEDETYTLRQMNHSNTMLLMNDMKINKLEKQFDGPKSSLLGIDQFSYIYEPTKLPGYIDTTGIPSFPGEDATEGPSLSDVEADSPIDKAHFFRQWYQIGGSTVNGRAVMLKPDFVTEALHTLISVLLTQKIADKDFECKNVIDKCLVQDARLEMSIVHSLLHRFGDETAPERFKLNTSACAEWFGIEALKKCSTSPLSDKEFMLKWKLSLPAFFNASLDLDLLRGRFFRPEPDKVRYLDRDLLSKDLHTRIKELFRVVREWDYEDFLAFIDGLYPSTKKADSIILKFARKKRVTKTKFLVCPK